MGFPLQWATTVLSTGKTHPASGCIIDSEELWRAGAVAGGGLFAQTHGLRLQKKQDFSSSIQGSKSPKKSELSHLPQKTFLGCHPFFLDVGLFLRALLSGLGFHMAL